MAAGRRLGAGDKILKRKTDGSGGRGQDRKWPPALGPWGLTGESTHTPPPGLLHILPTAQPPFFCVSICLLIQRTTQPALGQPWG